MAELIKLDKNIMDPLLSEQERAIVDKLADAWNLWAKLEKIHPQENMDFLYAIHLSQRIIMARPVQRQFNFEIENNQA